MRDTDKDLPEWTFRGGYFRAGFSSNDVPSAWTHQKGIWKRDELVPFGKASESYRQQFYTCPECDGASLLPTAEEYKFVCVSCSMEFGWGFGGLYEKESTQLYTPDDF